MHPAFIDIHDFVRHFQTRLACSDLPDLLIIEGALAIHQRIGSALMPHSVHVNRVIFPRYNVQNQ